MDILILALCALVACVGFILILWGFFTLIPRMVRDSKWPWQSTLAVVLGTVLFGIGYYFAAEQGNIIIWSNAMVAFVAGLILRNTVFANKKDDKKEDGENGQQ